MGDRRKSLTNAWAIYLVWMGVCSLFFWRFLAVLIRYALNNDDASHILLIPFIAAWLIYSDRTKISNIPTFDFLPALPFAFPAVLLWVCSPWSTSLLPGFSIPVRALSLVLFLVAGFIFVFGRSSARATWFSLTFLVFLIPLPEIWLNRAIYLLQYGSAAVAGWIFDLAGVPALRQGFVFQLPGFTIEVAQECSGIRSSTALLILALLVAHFAFAKCWKKVVFVVTGLLMTVIKNGVRIAILSILARYVDPDFLYGKLHHRGGVVFFVIGLALLVPVYGLLRRGETSRPGTQGSAAAG